MAVVTWLAVSFAILHYLEGRGPPWSRLLVISILGIGVLTLLVGGLTRVLDDWQSSSKPEESALVAIALFTLLVVALIVLAVVLSAVT